MTDGSRQSVPVRATRIGGAELRGGTIVLEEDALIIVLPVNSEERPVRVPFATIDKIGVEAEDVVVALLDGTRIEVLAESAPDELCDHLLARCCALPEVTRALRAFGSRRRQRDRRGGGAVEQQRFFAPLVDARRIAAKATVPHDVVAAFDPAAIAKAFDDTFNRAIDFQREARLGIYGKARLGNTFKWELKEMGYDEKFTETATEGLIVYLTRGPG